jgi:hypothetical protein
MGGEEGAFNMCTLWCIEAMVRGLPAILASPLSSSVQARAGKYEPAMLNKSVRLRLAGLARLSTLTAAQREMFEAFIGLPAVLAPSNIADVLSQAIAAMSNCTAKVRILMPSRTRPLRRKPRDQPFWVRRTALTASASS